MTARDEVLARIRTALGPGRREIDVPRDYRRDDPADQDGVRRDRTRGELLDLLAGRLVDYRAEVHRAGVDDVAAVVGAALRRLGARRVVVPAGLPPAWVPAWVDVLADDPPLTTGRLDGADAVLGTCTVAIAETGTLVLDGGPGQGRRALTLVPDAFVCVVRADDVVHGVPAALRRLDPRRPLTFVSGPSATSDIELQRVEGVHGPRTLVVVLSTGSDRGDVEDVLEPAEVLGGAPEQDRPVRVRRPGDEQVEGPGPRPTPGADDERGEAPVAVRHGPVDGQGVDGSVATARARPGRGRRRAYRRR